MTCGLQPTSSALQWSVEHDRTCCLKLLVATGQSRGLGDRDTRGSYRGSDRLRGVYTGGMAGITPDIQPSLDVLEEAALEIMDDSAYGYIAGGGERTIDQHRDAVARWRLWPRVLWDVADRILSTSLFSSKLSVPVVLAPMDVQSIMREAAELDPLPRLPSTYRWSSRPHPLTRLRSSPTDWAGQPVEASPTGRRTTTSGRASSVTPRSPATRRWW